MPALTQTTPRSNGETAIDPLLTAARVLLWVFLAGAIIALVASAIGIASQFAVQGRALLVPVWEPAWRPIVRLLFGIAALVIAIGIARTVLAMIDAVARGAAFESENARRMQKVANDVIGLQVLGFLASLAGVGIGGEINGFELGFDLSPGGVAFALLLFILARVFRQGAAMRADLEGTV